LALAAFAYACAVQVLPGFRRPTVRYEPVEQPVYVASAVFREPDDDLLVL
jgi:hypothetical protein